MKRIFILLFVSLLSGTAPAQESFSDCFKNSIKMNLDSAGKLAKNPFEVWKACVVEKKIPIFNGVSLSGDTVDINQLKGKVVVINFWFIDCHPCIAEIPGLNRLVDEYKGKDIVFLAITWESIKRMYSDFLPKYKLDFIIIPNVQTVINKIGVPGYPTTYIVDQKGIIKSAWTGGSIGDKAGLEYYEKAKPVIDGLLKYQ
ncbi:MAG: TlpA disulfide reductase family protein [Bacteroidota bacterium]